MRYLSVSIGQLGRGLYRARPSKVNPAPQSPDEPGQTGALDGMPPGSAYTSRDRTKRSDHDGAAVPEDAWAGQRLRRDRRARSPGRAHPAAAALDRRPAARHRLRPADRAGAAAADGRRRLHAHPQPRRRRGRRLRQRHALRRRQGDGGEERPATSIVETISGLLDTEAVGRRARRRRHGPGQAGLARDPAGGGLRHAASAAQRRAAQRSGRRSMSAIRMRCSSCPMSETVDLASLGPVLERHRLFPERANIEVAQILSPDRIRMRVWERGAGITQACGSGACATLVAAARRRLTGRSATVVLDGGELLIEWLRRQSRAHDRRLGARASAARSTWPGWSAPLPDPNAQRSSSPSAAASTPSRPR